MHTSGFAVLKKIIKLFYKSHLDISNLLYNSPRYFFVYYIQGPIVVLLDLCHIDFVK